MNLPISNRLLGCCAFVRPGDRVADVGTDHGYLGIHLLLQGVARWVIASDISRMPLDSALRNAEKYGVRDRMEFYLSDGVRAIPRDFDVLVCAGMGADTMIHILGDAPWLKSKRLVLQCQSRRPVLRRWLYENGFAVCREELAQDGKFYYPILEAVYRPGPPLTPGGYYITPALRASGSPLLPAFYRRVADGLRTTVEGLSRTGDSERLAYYRGILKELEGMEGEICGHRC